MRTTRNTKDPPIAYWKNHIQENSDHDSDGVLPGPSQRWDETRTPNFFWKTTSSAALHPPLGQQHPTRGTPGIFKIHGRGGIYKESPLTSSCRWEERPREEHHHPCCRYDSSSLQTLCREDNTASSGSSDNTYNKSSRLSSKNIQHHVTCVAK